ncbi:MAG: carbohydrate ABC transporter permease [Armatimonadota bacterium]|nr:carbohydrate ABC transporter permease [Armatimonadota bacterium]MDR7439837.1 carbohydrate ABC transporter permease [Armatimonadota bacterium]MDR7563431.1 carbohydrate ABC transporter permease [Armatimonadota bacterium]MDR7567775.1 carbohydrate ABC transporter permease [Armatimonadota bacterium]
MRRRPPIVAYILLGMWSMVVFFPLYWLVTASFKDALAVHQGPKFLPWVDFRPTLDAWRNLLRGVERETVWGPLLNSLVVGSSSSLLAMVLGASAAYGLARLPVRLGPMANEDMLFWIVSQRIMPPIVTALALFLMLRTVGLLDTRTGLVLVYVAFNLPLATWLMHNFFRQIPPSLEEAALVDGAGRARVLWHVVLPVSTPGLVATFLFCFLFAWNEFLFALILTFNRARTLPILIAAQHTQRGIEWWSLSAMSLITLAPVVLITLLLQGYLVGRVLGGGER